MNMRTSQYLQIKDSEKCIVLEDYIHIILFGGGFVHECTSRGTFKRFYKTKAKIIVLDVTDEQYKQLEDLIMRMKRNRKELRFNILGLFAIYFNKKIRRPKHFYCAEFIKYATEKSQIDLNLPELVRPDNFKELDGATVVYKGLLKEYC